MQNRKQVYTKFGQIRDNFAWHEIIILCYSYPFQRILPLWKEMYNPYRFYLVQFNSFRVLYDLLFVVFVNPFVTYILAYFNNNANFVPVLLVDCTDTLKSVL